MTIADAAVASELRAHFQRAGYTANGVLDQLGPVAAAALGRGERVPALRATSDAGPLSTLIRLFLLQSAVSAESAADALPMEAAIRAGLVRRSGAEVHASLDVRPYAADDAPDQHWWVASDLGRDFRSDGAVRSDHVLGVGGASTTLAHLTVRPQVQRALDLGTGCGVQALHLAQHASSVVATDVLARALSLARLTARLCEVPDEQLELLEGSLFEPVSGERFDLVVSNPPFVVHPETGAAEAGQGDGEFTYRDSGLAGDEVCARLVSQAPKHLAEGGWAQLLANWVHVRGADWTERVGGWLDPTGGCDAWIVQRDVQDIAEYVAMWLRDSGEVGDPRDGHRYERRYDAWLAAFERAGVEAVGFGYVALHRTDAAQPVVRLENWPHAVEQPLGRHILSWGRREEWLAARDDAALLAERLRVADDVRQEQVGRPGAEDPETVVLRQHRGMCRAEQVDTATAALVGASDGTLPFGALSDAVATVLEVDPAALRADLLPKVRGLIRDGFLEAEREAI